MLLKCDVCGGKIKVLSGGEFGECESCGANYTIDRMREIASGVKVSQTGSKEDIEQWRTLLKKYYSAGDFSAAENTVKKILEAAPNDEDANKKYDELQTLKYMEVVNGVLIKYTGKIKEVVIPDCVNEIGITAFRDCEFLQGITIPSSVTQIGRSAFWDCRSLQNITIPEGVTQIGAYAFYSCESLQSINIPSGVTEIGESAFADCESLRNITFGGGELQRKKLFTDIHNTPYYENAVANGACHSCGGKILFGKCMDCGEKQPK